MNMNTHSSPSQVMDQSKKTDQKIDDLPAFKKRRIVMPLLLLLIAVAGGGWYWYAKKHSTIATDDSFIDANRATVSSRILGRITLLNVDEDDSVHSGDTLVRLDDADIHAQIAKAEATIHYLTRSAEIASVNLAKAKDDFSRFEKQFKSSIISQEQYNHGENALKLADAQSQMAIAQIATAKAEMAILKTQLSNTAIISPFDGVIAKKWVMSGDVIQPGQAIFSLYDMKNIWITANYEETKLQLIHPGAKVQITIDAFPGMVLSGKVQSIGKTTASQFSLIPANNASGNYTKITQRVPVKISIDENAESRHSLLPGLSVSVNIFPGE
jgi:membrane fusion protein (multidrug efflux system)